MDNADIKKILQDPTRTRAWITIISITAEIASETCPGSARENEVC